MGVQSVLPGRTAWHVEFDANPSKVLAHNWPDVPNYGDVTTVDWDSVEPVDVLTGGYPCQPFSHAGKRRGTSDERHLWPYVAEAVAALRPGLCVFENVRGHLGLGFDQVLRDLHQLDYDVHWYSLRAADIGAAHRRMRLFIFAKDRHNEHPAGLRDAGTSERDPRCGVPQGLVVGAGAGPVRPGRVRGEVPHMRADDLRAHLRAPLLGGAARAESGGTPGLGAALGLGPEGYEEKLFPTPDASPEKFRLQGDSQQSRSLAGMAGRGEIGRLLPTPRATDGPNHAGSSGDLILPSAVQPRYWGDYASAVARWEQVMGRPAPDPTEPGSKGNPRLSAPFVEWLMGLPAGHVTDPAIGITRNSQLKALGNGVVPAQSAAATAAWVQDMREETTP